MGGSGVGTYIIGVVEVVSESVDGWSHPGPFSRPIDPHHPHGRGAGGVYVHIRQVVRMHARRLGSDHGDVRPVPTKCGPISTVTAVARGRTGRVGVLLVV